MQFELEAYGKMLRVLQRKQGATIDELEVWCTVSRPTLYRWIQRAREQGHDVVQRRAVYFINNNNRKV